MKPGEEKQKLEDKDLKAPKVNVGKFDKAKDDAPPSLMIAPPRAQALVQFTIARVQRIRQ